MAIAKLEAMLGLDAKAYKAGMKDAKTSTTSFQASIAKVGSALGAAFTVGAIVSYGKSVVEWASKISESAQNVGVLTAEMIALNEISLKNGMEVDQLSIMLSKLQTKLGDAIDNGGESEKVFTDLGLSIETLSKMNPAQMLEEVARAAVKSGDPLTALANIVGERLGPKAVSAIRELAEDGLGSLNTEAADAADEIERLGDEFDKMANKAKAGIASTVSRGWGDFKKGVGIVVGKAMGIDSEQMLSQYEQDEQRDKNLKDDEKAAEQSEAKKSREARLAARKRRDEEKAEAKKAANQYKQDMDRLDELISESKKRRQEKEDRDAERAKTQAAYDEKINSLTEQYANAQKSAGYNGQMVDEMTRRGGMSKNGGVGQIEVASKQLAVQREQLRVMTELAGIVKEYNDFNNGAK
jgi:hypothetical protein